MEFLLLAYAASLAVLVGVILIHVYSSEKEKLYWKYYCWIKDDASFWQMKIEQSGENIGEMILNEKMRIEEEIREDEDREKELLPY